jgi:hypothetical protein
MERAKRSINVTIVSIKLKFCISYGLGAYMGAYWHVLGVLEYQFRFNGAFGLKGVDEPLILIVSNCVSPIVIGRLRVSN